MSEQVQSSKLDKTIKGLLIVLVCLLSFCIGIYSGKVLSDKNHDLAQLNSKDYAAEKFTQSASVKEAAQPEELISDKDIEEITQNAMVEARKEMAKKNGEPERGVASVPAATHAAGTHAAPSKTAAGAKAAPVAASTATASAAPAAPAPQAAPAHAASTKIAAPQPDTSGVQKAADRISQGKAPAAVSAGDGEYTVQVASYPTPEEAQRHAKKLVEQGFPAFQIPAEVKGKTWYRVNVGTFKTTNEAQKFRDQVNNQTGQSSSLVVKVAR